MQLNLRRKPIADSNMASPGLYALVTTDWKPIFSGHHIEITTSDSRTISLPSFKLLEMQWYLQRVAVLAGAADINGQNKLEASISRRRRRGQFPDWPDDISVVKDGIVMRRGGRARRPSI